MPRVRFTVRGMMVAVAVVAATLGIAIPAYRLAALRSKYRGFAASYSMMAIRYDMWARYERGEGRLAQAQEFEKRKRMPELLADKYALAARYPWLPVAPDPPEPE